VVSEVTQLNESFIKSNNSKFKVQIQTIKKTSEQTLSNQSPIKKKLTLSSDQQLDHKYGSPKIENPSLMSNPLKIF
jgi:hypothetical protein